MRLSQDTGASSGGFAAGGVVSSVASSWRIATSSDRMASLLSIPGLKKLNELVTRGKHPLCRRDTRDRLETCR